jgi:Mce-associated membrane protein
VKRRQKETGMTDLNDDGDEKVDDAEHADAGDAGDASASDEADNALDTSDDPPSPSGKSRLGSKGPWPWVAAVLVAAVLGAGVFGFIKYDEVTGQLEQLRQSQADRDIAAQLAKDYALKSLNYTFEDPDAFFRAVEDGVSQQLKDKYVNATELLKAVMLEAQVSSTGEVLAADPIAQADGSYQVVVAAHQTTRNLQNPTPKVSIILLQITVHKVDGVWQVSDIGPKTGTNPPVEQELPTPPPPPPSGPAPTKPTPQR